MTNKFSKGDIVTLKSQFKPMTVFSISSGDSDVVHCQCFNSDSKLEIVRLFSITLRRISEKELKRHEKQVKRREDAKAGSSLSDKAFKWATLIGALTAAVASIAVAVK